MLILAMIYVFAIGCCVGSFLNVVIYRSPRGLSLIKPPSSCPGCNYRIPAYLNIPLVSWLMLRGRCRNCGYAISPRYFIVELFTGIIFAGLFYLYFVYGIREMGFADTGGALSGFTEGGWIIFLLHIILISTFLAASAIDLELYIIPLSLCYFVFISAIIIAGVAPAVIPYEQIVSYKLLPAASPAAAAVTTGSLLGLFLSFYLLKKGIIKRSYPLDDQGNELEEYNHRKEAMLEVAFLLPVIVLGVLSLVLYKNLSSAAAFWDRLGEIPSISCIMGALWGYLVGCAVVWAARIGGTLAFGKEAMGLGDVHLLGAAGAVIGGGGAVLAFLISPFSGILCSVLYLVFKKTNQIPYGPFLSFSVILVIIFNDQIQQILNLYFY
ncbi:Leader peptidase PppA [Limihaloglobus sulfuriphilus]|uniref:Leader peptidase PppA n=1 Tax=Limihaloglobus sulfuriphilus TaxID=1851148 RepID=A0A1Q2MIA9_9BACT|nr:A24 family peptidase [Limihaloglobus sulfuriphilus]AQQ72445.1 Leader peptidase PppA [Limihaloglobus sulfuriphilus]